VLFAQTNAAWVWNFLAHNKDSFDTLESIVTIVGIVVGGVWAYLLFVKRRQKFPRAVLKHSIESWEVSENERLVRVVLLVENKGEVLLRILDGFTWVQQMRPWPGEVIQGHAEAGKNAGKASAPSEIAWPLIAERPHKTIREIEPAEVDEICVDFIIDKGFEQVLVYSFLANSKKSERKLGWMTSTVIDLTKADGSVLQQIQGQAKQKPRPENAQSQPKPRPGGPRK